MTEWRTLPLTQRSLADADLPTRGVFKLGSDLTPRVVYVVWFSEPEKWQKLAAEQIVYAAHVRHVMPGTIYPGCPWA